MIDMQNAQAFIDIAPLRQMTGNDSAFLIEVLELIRNQSPIMLLQMQDSLRQDDLNSLGATAHKLKSTLHVLGNSDWLTLLKELEYWSKEEGDKSASASLLEDFQNVCDQMLDRIDDELSQLRAEAA